MMAQVIRREIELLKEKRMKKTYLLFDSRYHDDPDRAICLTVSDSLNEAKGDRRTMFSELDVIVEYDVTDDNELINPKVVG